MALPNPPPEESDEEKRLAALLNGLVIASALGLDGPLDARIVGLVGALRDGTLARGEFITAVKSEMALGYLGAYTDAAIAIDPAIAMASADVAAIERLTAQQAAPINTLANDVLKGTDQMAIEARAAMYRDTLHTATQEGRLEASLRSGERLGITPLIEWRLGEAEHCDPCLEAAQGSPYRDRESLPGMPGYPYCEGGGNCECEVVALF